VPALGNDGARKDHPAQLRLQRSGRSWREAVAAGGDTADREPADDGDEDCRRPDVGQRPAAKPDTGAGAGSDSGRSPADAERPDHRLVERSRWDHREDDREARTLLADLRSELMAACAGLEVALHLAAPKRSTAQHRQLFADALARRLAGLAPVAEGGARLEHEGLHGSLVSAEHSADIRV
jgi:hypothetical protein